MNTQPLRIGLIAAVAGLFALSATACGSGSDDKAGATTSPSVTDSMTTMPASSAPPQDAPTTGAPATAPSKAPGNGASGAAVKLPVTANVRSGVIDAYLMAAMKTYLKEKQANLQGPEGLLYGKVRGVFYAVAEIGFSDNPMSRQDGPEVWRSKVGGGEEWEYLGDTGGDVCGKVPAELVRVWGRSCN